MRDSLINTCAMKMRKLLDKKSEVLAQKYGVRNVELEILLFLYHSPCGDTAKDIVSSLNEEGCDYVIAIAHGGDAFAHEIAKSVDDINTVVASCDVDEKWEVETEGDTNIFIYPGYKFKCIDGLITNFHLPESTLVMLVSALAGREYILKAYNEAVKEEYKFFSFGDAMFIK